MMMRSSILALLVFILSWSSLPQIARAWSTGSGTCNAREDSVLAQTGRHPVTPNLGFYLSLPLQYKVGSPVTVAVLNVGRNANISGFNGFLLYASDSSGRRVGQWTDVPGVATTDMVNAVEAQASATSGRFVCEGADSATLTHSTGGVKRLGLQLTFAPPATAQGRLTFHGLVLWTSALYYTQVLTPIAVCPTGDDSCRAFDPSTLPSGPLPLPPTAGAVTPFGLQPIDATACEDFAAVPNAVVPPGFCASLYTEANLVNRPRGIVVTSAGDLLVLESGGNPTGVALLRDLDGDGTIRKNEYTRIFNQPALNHGLYVRGGWMYTSSPNTVWRVAFDAKNPARLLTDATVVVKGIPGGGHATRTTLVSHDGRWLYVSVGSAGNLDNDDSRSRVIRYDLSRTIPAGGYQWNDYANNGVQAFAKGLRNEVGLILDLQGEVWGAMNADDNLNRPDLGGFTIHNDNPAERIDHLREERMVDGWYGYPYCWAADILQGHVNGDLFGWGGDGKDWYRQQYDDAWCRANTIPASYALEAHTAPLGLLFYDGRGRYAFPPEYYNQIFVAQHGSWNSDTPRGYKVTRIGTDPRGQALANTSRDFMAYRGPGAIASGWPHKPADVKVGPAGELFVSSPDSNSIMVVRHINPPRSPVTIPRALGAGYNYSTLGGPTRPLADFAFDRRPAAASNADFRWMEGEGAHYGLALFDGSRMFVNTTRADNGVGVASPNVTGGLSSYETWLALTALPRDGQLMVVWEFSQPAEGDQDGWIRLAVDSSGVFRFGHKAAGAAEEVLQGDSRAPVKADGQWWHVVVIANGTEMTLIAQTEAGRGQSSAVFKAPLPLMHRRSGLLGRAYRSGSAEAQPQMSPVFLHGLMDAFRMYSFPLSVEQVALSFALQSTARVLPALQINLHMQPSEYSEANWTHAGPNSRYAPTTSTYFPGWASFNGAQSIDLQNPGASMGGVWRDQLSEAAAFSVEMWVRAPLGRQTSAFSILRAAPLLSVFHDPATSWSSVSVAREGGAAVEVTSLLTPYWTQLVLMGRNGNGSIYVNGSATALSFTGSLTRRGLTEARLGEGFIGDVAILRVFDVELSAAQVALLFAAQNAEAGRRELQVAPRADWDDNSAAAPISLAGIIGLVLAISAFITAAIVLGLWLAHRKSGAVKAPANDIGISLLAQ